MMMLALPSMTTRMRRFERHRHAIQDAGDLDEDEFLDDGDEELDDLDEEFEEESSIHKTKSKRRRSRRSSSKRDEDVEQQQQQQNSHRTSPLALARSFLRRTHLRISSNPLPRRAAMLMNNNQKMPTTTASSSTQILPLSSSSPMRKKLAFDSSWNAKSLQPVLAHRSSTSANDENRRRQWKNDRDLVESCTGHSSSSLSDIVNVVTNDFISEAPSTFSRPSSENDSGNNNNNNGSSTPSSSMNTRLVNRVKSNEGHKKKFKNLTRNYSHKHRTLTLPDEIDASTGQPIRRASRSEIRFPAFLRQFSMRSPKIFRQPRPSLDIAGSRQQTISRNCYRDSYRQCIRQPSMSAPEYPASEHPTTSATDTETLSTTMSPPTVRAASGSSDIAQLVVNGRGNDKNGAHQPIAIDFVCPKMTTSLISGSIMTDSMQSDGHQRNELSEPSNELSLMDNDHEAFMAIDDCEAFLLRNPMARNAPVCLGETPDTMPNTPSRSPSMISPPMVTFSSTVHELDAEDRRTKPKSLRAGSVDIERLAGAVVGTPPLSPQKVQNEKHGDRVYPSLPAGIITCDFMPDSNNPNAAVPRYSAPDASSSGGTGEAASRKESNLSSSIGGDSQNKQQQQQQQKTKKTVGIARSNGASGGLAVRIVKKTINRKESSLKRKVSKAQRKEKRATKTLGIVVGVFLICWVPFFSMNILNAVCIKLNAPQCEIGYAPFFYSTWIGYMNSFVNPIIYTVILIST